MSDDTGADSKVVLTDQQRLVHGILTSLTAALSLVVEARAHHALCIRSFGMVQMYEKDWPLFYLEKFPTYDEEKRESLKRWYQWIKVTAESAEEQKAKGYIGVTQRSIILLSDILENLTESFLQICLKYIDDKVVPIKRVTGRRPRDMESAGEIRRSVRVWERSLAVKSRLGRFVVMIQTFFPKFSFPEDKQLNLDALIEARNAFTHELIVISPTCQLDNDAEPVSSVTEESVQSYFDDLGAYILALMDAFKDTAGRPRADAPEDAMPN